MAVKKHQLTIKGLEFTYLVVDYHRNNTPGKSQWIISEREEIKCFENAVINKWSDESNYFSLKKDVRKKLVALGKNKFHEKLYLAKYTANPKDWHGYPADHVRNSNDIPSQVILDSWMKNKTLPKHKVFKIQQGKPCNP